MWARVSALSSSNLVRRIDDLFLEGDVGLEHLGQRERARHAADQGDVDDAEGGLHLGVLVELVEHDHGDGVALELDDEAHAGAVGFVAQVGDLGDLLGLTRSTMFSMRAARLTW